MRRTLRARVIGATSAVALVAGLTVALTAGSRTLAIDPLNPSRCESCHASSAVTGARSAHEFVFASPVRERTIRSQSRSRRANPEVPTAA